MNEKHKATIIRLAKYLLNDSCGISTEACNELVSLLLAADDQELYNKIVEKDDGRYFIPIGEL